MVQHTFNSEVVDLEPPPPVIGGYRLGELIGVGGVGAVYEGVAERDATAAAVKVMRPSPFLNLSLLAAIVDSALATRKFSTATRVVKVFGGGTEQGVCYIAMELFKGGTLRRLVDEPGNDVKKKLSTAISLADTLALVHAQGVIHGDLKPTNVLLGKDGEPYLNDFYHFPGKNTGVGGTLFALPQGTPSYMSPEQAQGQFVSYSTDIYSFGVLCYELLTGRLPYEVLSGNISVMINAIVKSQITPPRKVVSGISEELDAVAMKLLERKRESRYKSMESISLDLRACLEGGRPSVAVPRSLGGKILSMFRKERLN